MNRIRTIIVDDETLALNLIRSYLDKIDIVEIVAECANGSQAVSEIHKLEPDLVLLDIQMPGLNGFDVINSIQADIMPCIIFVTAYDQYAVKAFDVNAIDYLLKPLDPTNLKRAISRCADRFLNNNGANNNKTHLLKSLHQINNDSEYQKIVIKDRDVIHMIEQHNIDWVDAAGDYMCLHVEGETIIMRSTLKALLKRLDPTVFQRVHRSTIVNLDRIEKIIPFTKGEFYLELNNKERIKVSRNYNSTIKNLISN